MSEERREPVGLGDAVGGLKSAALLYLPSVALDGTKDERLRGVCAVAWLVVALYVGWHWAREQGRRTVRGTLGLALALALYYFLPPTLPDYLLRVGQFFRLSVPFWGVIAGFGAGAAMVGAAWALIRRRSPAQAMSWAPPNAYERRLTRNLSGPLLGDDPSPPPQWSQDWAALGERPQAVMRSLFAGRKHRMHFLPEKELGEQFSEWGSAVLAAVAQRLQNLKLIERDQPRVEGLHGPRWATHPKVRGWVLTNAGKTIISEVTLHEDAQSSAAHTPHATKPDPWDELDESERRVLDALFRRGRERRYFLSNSELSRLGISEMLLEATLNVMTEPPRGWVQPMGPMPARGQSDGRPSGWQLAENGIALASAAVKRGKLRPEPEAGSNERPRGTMATERTSPTLNERELQLMKVLYKKPERYTTDPELSIAATRSPQMEGWDRVVRGLGDRRLVERIPDMSNEWGTVPPGWKLTPEGMRLMDAMAEEEHQPKQGGE